MEYIDMQFYISYLNYVRIIFQSKSLIQLHQSMQGYSNEIQIIKV